jgi:hypothetical protein
MKKSDVISTIEILENLNQLDEYAYEHAILAFLKLSGLPVFMYEFAPGLFTYHTRTHDENEDYFLRISDISIPPKIVVKNFARCNRPFQSVFYSSENRQTSYSELLEYWSNTRNPGDILKVTIGKWELKKTLTAILVTTPDIDKRISNFDKEHGKALDKILENYKGEELESYILFFRYLTEKFRKAAKNDLKTYIITSAYCNAALMHSNGQAYSIYYPSVPSQEVGINLAINSNFFTDENFELKSAMRNKFEVFLNDEGKHHFKEIENSMVATKEIITKENFIFWENYR